MPRTEYQRAEDIAQELAEWVDERPWMDLGNQDFISGATVRQAEASLAWALGVIRSLPTR